MPCVKFKYVKGRVINDTEPYIGILQDTLSTGFQAIIFIAERHDPDSKIFTLKFNTTSCYLDSLSGVTSAKA